MKLTRHNGRSGKDGVYSTRHNDRQFDVENSDHVDPERVEQNIYWDRLDGFYRRAPGEELPEGRKTFEEVEEMFYRTAFKDYVEGQNERNAKIRHTERNRTTDDLRKDKKTCPEETIFQIGNVDDGYVDDDVFAEIVAEFLNEFDKLFGEHVKILDMALHLDETSPHIHERHVFLCENRYGETAPRQEKALEALGFGLAKPGEKPGRYNNRKIVFDSACRALLFDISKKHGLELDVKPEQYGRDYLERRDYIIHKQEERIAKGEQLIGKQEETIARQEERIDELTMRIGDVESLIDDVSETAYDKAVEVVTDMAMRETQKEDIRILAAAQKEELEADQMKPDPKRRYAAGVIGRAARAIRQNTQRVLENVRAALSLPAGRSEGVEQVKAQARESILEKLKSAQADAAKQNRNGGKQEQTRDMHGRDL